MTMARYTGQASAAAQRWSPALPSHNPTPARRGITELLLTRHSPDSQVLLLPMLAHLSQDKERWVTWITDQKIDRQRLAGFGIDSARLRVVSRPSQQDRQWMLWEALNNGTSHTVIAQLDSVSDSDLAHYEAAAEQGNCHGLLVHYR